jgi:uncharacterized protein (TIGR01777 family)
MKVLVAGGSGLIGSALTRSLLGDGHEVWVLTRDPRRARLSENVHGLSWDGLTPAGWGKYVSEMDVVVNLAGATIASWPWTMARKQRILQSRVNAGAALTKAIDEAKPRPQVLVQASGVGYYGPCGVEVVTEDTPPGDDFFAEIAQQWEASSRLVDVLGVRRVIIRSAVVLTKIGGILPLMALPVRLFVGGRLGEGKQGFPWIHIDDEIRAIRFLIDNPRARGAFNLAAPNPLSSAEFIRRLAKVMRRPYWLPVPAVGLHLVLGEMSTLLLHGQYAVPKRLVEAGYQFKYQQAHEALEAIFG